MMNLYPFMMMPVYNLPNEEFFRPPLLCDLLNSLVNYDKPEDEKVKLSLIPQAATSKVFDFEYPLSSNVDKEKFETMLLKKFYTRRIGFETYTLWKMQLDLKLNEIMPVYNKLFDAMYNWNLFTDGENYTRTIDNNKESSNESETNSSTTTTATNNVSNTRKFSNLPQNEINDIENNSYMTDYTRENNTGTSNGSGTGSGSSSNTLEETNNTVETYQKDVSNRIDIYNKFIEDRNHIMTLIYKDLDSLFYGLSNYN